MMWEANAFVSRKRDLDAIMLGETISIPERELYWERMAAIDALQQFIWYLEGMCDDQNSTSL